MTPRASASSTSVRAPHLWGIRAFLAVALVTTNLVGAVIVFSLAALVVPLPRVADDSTLRLQNLVLAAGYVGLAVLVGMVRGLAITRRTSRWVREQREPDEHEKRSLLHVPGRLSALQAALWGLGALSFGLFNARTSVTLGTLVALIVSLAGLSVCTVAYLLAERALRPLARIALSSGVPKRVGMRMGLRTLFAWLLGSAISILGIILAGLTALGLADQVSVQRLAITMVTLGGIAFGVGFLSIWLAAKASSDPVRALRRTVEQVSRGDLHAEVPIYDGTELGVLQAGFNEMLHGLREREQIRDLFGRHVGDDVARAALEGGVQLGGEVRDVAVLFVDIIGSTSLATHRPPQEVVGLLNRFFEVVIDVVHTSGGLVNKFEGDAALAIWGAPVQLPDKAAAVLRAARTLGERLHAEVPELEASIGVSAGPAVAGNVGAAERYEYTVIGDPVNEAARLTEIAKSVPALVLAHAGLLAAAGEEAAYWTVLESVTVRGRTQPTPIATPVPRRMRGASGGVVAEAP